MRILYKTNNVIILPNMVPNECNIQISNQNREK